MIEEMIEEMIDEMTEEMTEEMIEELMIEDHKITIEDHIKITIEEIMRKKESQSPDTDKVYYKFI